MTVLKSSICSGGMNGTVPRISPEKVRPERPTPRKLLASPKSEIFTSKPSGVLAIADNGDQSVLEATPQGVGTISVVAGTGGNGPYLQDGLSATGPTAELNDPEGVAVSSLGTLSLTDGLMHAIRVVPAGTGTVLGRAMNAGDMYTLAGAMPVSDPSGAGNGTQWVTTRVNRPVGIALSPFGGVFFVGRASGHMGRLEASPGVTHQVGEKEFPELARRHVATRAFTTLEFTDAPRDCSCVGHGATYSR